MHTIGLQLAGEIFAVQCQHGIVAEAVNQQAGRTVRIDKVDRPGVGQRVRGREDALQFAAAEFKGVIGAGVTDQGSYQAVFNAAVCR